MTNQVNRMRTAAAIAIVALNGLWLIGQSNTVVSVLPFQNRTHDITDPQVVTISDRMESLLVQSGLYSVITVSQREELLKEQKFQTASGCVEQSCAVEIGKLLGAQFILSGAISQVEDVYLISAKMFNVVTGEIEQVAEFSTMQGVSDLYFTGTDSIIFQISGIQVTGAWPDSSITNPDSTQTAYLTVDVTPPDAILMLDGMILTGAPPLMNYPISMGFHELAVSARYHRNWLETIAVPALDTLDLGHIALAIKNGIVEICTDPPGAECRIDGVLESATPCRIPLDYGMHDLAFSLPGYEEYSGKMIVEDSYTLEDIDLVSRTVAVAFTADRTGQLYIGETSAGTIGKEPLLLEMEAGYYPILIAAKGCESIQDEIHVTSRSDNTFHYRFIEIAEESASRNRRRSEQFRLGIGASIGFPGLLNYDLSASWSIFQFTFSKGFTSSVDKLDISNFVDHADYGIHGDQFTFGLGSQSAGIHYIQGSNDYFNRNIGLHGELTRWKYHGIGVRKTGTPLTYELGWLWGDDVYREEYFYFKLGLGLNIAF